MLKSVTLNDIESAIRSASKGRKGRRDIREVLEYLPQVSLAIHDLLVTGDWENQVSVRRLTRTNSNGKVRHIISPRVLLLILQHLAILKLSERYRPLDPMVGLNCKPGCGITANWGRGSVLARIKHLYYDLRHLHYVLVIDQRKCYEHMRKPPVRKALKALVKDKWLCDFILDVSFWGREFPIGMPASPPMHHLMMLDFDLWLQANTPYCVRYADDVLCAFETAQEANAMKWRIKQYWWYKYGMRAKRHTVKVVGMDIPLDFCGYVFHRNPNPSGHDKGYTTIRRDTYERATRCSSDRSWASYFGLMRHADTFSAMCKIEKEMKLSELTKTIRLDRSLDARNIEVKELVDKGIVFDIVDYDMRCDKDNNPNWIKCMIAIPEVNASTGELTGRIIAREFHTGSESIVAFHVLCEQKYGKKNLLPMQEMKIVNQCGYIYEGSTNVIEFFRQEGGNKYEAITGAR